MTRKRLHTEVKSSASASEDEFKLTPPLAKNTSKRLSEATVRGAVDALLNDFAKHEQKRMRRAEAQGKAGPIVEGECFVMLVITFKQPPLKDKLRPEAIRLKHSLRTADDEVLLIVRHPQRLVKDYLAEHGNGGVTRVLEVDKVRKRYGTHEGRRELLQQYDHFLVDSRVAPMMPSVLGKAFITAKRMPLAVNMQRDVVGCIERALCSTAFCARRGTCTSVRVARMEWETDKIVENVVGVIEGVVKKVDGGWDGVQSLMIKSNKSPGLPIYVAMPGWVPRGKARTTISEEYGDEDREEKRMKLDKEKE